MTDLTPEQVVADLARTVTVMQEEGRAAMDAAVELTAEEMSRLAPGSIGQNLTRSVRDSAGGVSGTVKPRGQIARWVNEGTGEGKVIRNRSGQAYSAVTRNRLSGAEEASGAHELLTASGYGRKTGGAMPLKIDGRTIFRTRVSGQAAQHFVERTRENVTERVVELLEGAAQRATDRLFK